jgi:pilus assembly protein CpaB
MMIRSDDPQPQAPKDRRKRKIPVRGIVFLTVAVAAALAAAVLLTKYMDARVAAARVPTTKIVVADVDIPVATPIKTEWLKAIDWPATARPEGAVSDPAAIVNQVAIVPITRGEPVLPAKLAVGGAARSGLATLVPEGMRAVAVKVDDVVGVAGFIHPGDNVDVLVTMQPRNDAPFVSKIVLQNIKVIAVGKNLEHRGKDAREAIPVTVATLMVTSEESERLALSTDKGHILLALRGLGDEQFADTRGITPPVLLLTSAPETKPESPVAAAPSRARRRELARAVTPAPEPPKEKQTIEILRGDLFEKRSFDAQEKRP